MALNNELISKCPRRRKTIDCGVSIKALRDHSGAYVDDPLPGFRSRCARIQEIAAKLITERRLEDNGTVIRTGGALKTR
jgi:hypothetical protein